MPLMLNEEYVSNFQAKAVLVSACIKSEFRITYDLLQLKFDSLFYRMDSLH